MWAEVIVSESVSVYRGGCYNTERTDTHQPLADCIEKAADSTLKDKKRQNREKKSTHKVTVELKYSDYDFLHLWCKRD